MKTLLKTGLATLAGLVMMSPAMAGSPVVRVMVRDANGQARAAYVRTSDRRVLYPQVVQQVAKPGQPVQYLPANSSAYRPEFFPGFGVLRPDIGYGNVILPGRLFYPVGNGYPRSYRPSGNYGVDSILYNGSRGKFGIPGYGMPAGAFPRPVVRPQTSGLPAARYSGNVKGQ